MALDVFHQVLARLYELAGGNPRQMVSIVDVLKQEKLFGSSDMITDRLQAEGWIADAPARGQVYVTTWGIDEVRRASAPAPAAETLAPVKAAEPKNAAALRAATVKVRQLVEVLEEAATGAGGISVQRRSKVKKALASAVAAVEEAFE